MKVLLQTLGVDCHVVEEESAAIAKRPKIGSLPISGLGDFSRKRKNIMQWRQSMGDSLQELQSFIDGWNESEEKNKSAFVRLKSHLATREGVQLEFIPRPGVTYSLRASHPNQEQRSLFVMVDVIEDSPRWLSVCFYGDTITDPEDLGDFVPEGLLGEDAACFDIDAYDDDLLQYVESRMDEARQSAGAS